MKTIFISSCITRSIAFICITIAAVYFHSVGVLWWYLVPALMGITIKDGGVDLE